MSKEMSLNEKLEKLMDRFEEMDEKINFGSEFKTEYDVNWYTDIREALNRLEAIDNANPSEALECLEKLNGMEISSMPFSDEYGTQEVDLNDIRKVGSQLNTDFREYTTTIKQALLKAEKEHNSVNLLMQELDCKDFAELRKYARCGYEKLNNFKGSKEVKIEIPESSLMDYNPVKHYLKWEDLEFKHTPKTIDVKMGENKYTLNVGCNVHFDKLAILKNGKINYYFLEADKQFFNDLHLERVEE